MVNIMIEPYASVVNSALTEFTSNGFMKVNETDYSVSFSDGKNIIEISTEKYYHPGLTTCLIDESGKKYSMRLLREILSPSELERDSAELSVLKKRYGLDDSNADRRLQNEGLTAYVTLAIRQFLNFLSSYRSELLSNLESYQAEYAIREASLLKSLGF